MGVTALSVLAAMLSIGGNVLINLRRRMGFLVWTIGNAAWIAVNLTGSHNYPQIAMWFVYAALNVHGFFMWRRKE